MGYKYEIQSVIQFENLLDVRFSRLCICRTLCQVCAAIHWYQCLLTVQRNMLCAAEGDQILEDYNLNLTIIINAFDQSCRLHQLTDAEFHYR
jgi:hypothetical protein